jgi:hypothetical protein
VQKNEVIMALKIEFLYEDGEPVKQLNNEVLDEDKIRAILRLNMYDTITSGYGSEKAAFQIIKITEYFNAAETPQGEDSMYFKIIVKTIPK